MCGISPGEMSARHYTSHSEIIHLMPPVAIITGRAFPVYQLINTQRERRPGHGSSVMGGSADTGCVVLGLEPKFLPLRL